MKSFWDDKEILNVEINKVREAYESNPIEITKDTKQEEIIDYLKYIRNQTCNGLYDSYKLLRMALEIDS